VQAAFASDVITEHAILQTPSANLSMGLFFFYVAQTLRPHQPNDDFSFLRGAPSTTTSQGNHLSGIYPSQGTTFLQRAAAKMRN
jgi:hypothetical protein